MSWNTVNEDAAAARRYRQHARGVRAMAIQIQDPTIRSALDWIARDYETMAQLRVKMGKLARSLRKHTLPHASAGTFQTSFRSGSERSE
jgi:hypothetical protein